MGKNWSSSRVADEWYRLGRHVVSVSMINTFERELDKFMGKGYRH